MVLHKLPDNHIEARVFEVVERLRASGFRVGPQRLRILRTLISSQMHPSVDRLHEELATNQKSISRSTIYKTLSALRSINEVLVIEFSESSGSSNRFDGYRPDPHPHLICLNCGDISDLETPQLESTLTTAGRLRGRRIDGFRIDLFSTCSACQSTDLGRRHRGPKDRANGARQEFVN